MKTRTAPWDYDQNKGVGLPQLTKLCDRCGGYMVNHHEVFHCTACRSTTFVIPYETEVATFRRGLMEIEEEKARHLALEVMPQMDVFLELVGAALNLDAETEALMNSWIAEEQTAQIDELVNRAYMDGSDNRPSTQWREHGNY